MGQGSTAGRLGGELREIAREAGAELVGLVPAVATDEYAGIHVGWTVNRSTVSVRRVLPGARTVAVLGCRNWDASQDLAVFDPERRRWAYPSWGMASRLRYLALYLVRRGWKVADGSPLLSYKNLARLAGFGPMGKSSLALHDRLGPRFRIGCLITDAETDYDRPWEEDLCGACSACLDACPAGALEPYRVDAGRCLVGRTVGRDRPPRPDELGGQARVTDLAHVMCRACQEACPLGRGNGP